MRSAKKPRKKPKSDPDTVRSDAKPRKKPKSDRRKVRSTAGRGGGRAASGARKVGSGARVVGTKVGSGIRKVGSQAGNQAKRAGSGARKAGVGAARAGAGAARLALVPGKRMKSGMNNLNERMVEVEWTPSVMVKEYVRFNLTGIFNTIVFLLLYELFYWLNLWGEHRAVSAWVVAAVISQVQSHFTHYRFTFGSEAPYLQSLKWAMIVYTTALALSTTSEYYLIEVMGIYHRLAWLINALFFGFMNFAALRWLAFPPEYDRLILSEEE